MPLRSRQSETLCKGVTPLVPAVWPGRGEEPGSAPATPEEEDLDGTLEANGFRGGGENIKKRWGWVFSFFFFGGGVGVSGRFFWFGFWFLVWIGGGKRKMEYISLLVNLSTAWCVDEHVL